MATLYTVSLSEAERRLLTEAARHPKASNRFTTRARILLVADQSEDGPRFIVAADVHGPAP
jgi:hypothetical protein